MGRVETYPPGTFCWVDLAASDVERVAAFYRAVFDWDVQVAGPSASARLDGAVVAGISVTEPRTDLSDAGWRSFVRVDDRVAAAERVRRLGGQTSEAGDLVTDPAGAAFRLAESGDPVAEVVNEVGAWSWSELVTPNLETASSFYAELFGWRPEPIPGLPRLAWRMGEQLIGGAHEPMSDEPAPARWDVSFRVADVDAAVTRVLKLGGAVVLPAMDIPVGRFAVVTDPEGASMTLNSFAEIVGGVDQLPGRR